MIGYLIMGIITSKIGLINNFIIYLILLIIALVISSIHPFDRTTWLLEVFPVLIALPVLIFTQKNYLLTRLLYPNNLGRFINLVKKTASQATGYFSNFTTDQAHQRPYTDVIPQAP